MNRDKLIAQVKNEYARIASSESQQHFHQTTTEITPEAYYENLLSNVIDEINKGTFDNFKSGEEVVTAIANDKSWLSGWK
ncbi:MULTISPECIES: hypothetical protein [Clostridia]|jgi:hypothetical protein|uniref:Uncharacterized protein n=1 Tax=Clostridium boliviensis TaxID=318465 RepID=A0ABU4GK57_9CLOT|nr:MULTISPECIES: hypothetical protein [Clostridia]MDK2966245.1 hypothetical protein [Lacrimispora sp.]MDW2798003.1 hypothetical protein [Clostridium boliviensis]